MALEPAFFIKGDAGRRNCFETQHFGEVLGRTQQDTFPWGSWAALLSGRTHFLLGQGDIRLLLPTSLGRLQDPKDPL